MDFSILLSDDVLLVDVREEDEWNAGHIEKALHLPMSRLVKFELIETLPKDKKLYLFCASGKRALLAKKILDPYISNVEALSCGYQELKNQRANS